MSIEQSKQDVDETRLMPSNYRAPVIPGYFGPMEPDPVLDEAYRKATISLVKRYPSLRDFDRLVPSDFLAPVILDPVGVQK